MKGGVRVGAGAKPKDPSGKKRERRVKYLTDVENALVDEFIAQVRSGMHLDKSKIL